MPIYRKNIGMDLSYTSYVNYKKGNFSFGALSEMYNLQLVKERKERGCSVNTYFRKKFAKDNAENIFDTFQVERTNFFKTYITDEYSIKDLMKMTRLSYSLVRDLLNFYQVPIRKGYSVVTDRLREKRSFIAKVNGENKTGWMSHDAQQKIHNHYEARGIQGYYLKKDDEYVWLRSTYEYIFAKWLDNHDINWKYEFKTFQLKNGRHYRPDFFIFENENVVKIVEIKGYWQNGMYKALELETTENIEVSVITDINSYTTKSYGEELKEWKKIRKINENNKNKNF